MTLHCINDNDTAEYRYRDGAKTWSHEYVLNVLSPLLRPIKSNARILDFGCGNGAATANLARPGWEMHGVDSSRSGIEAASRTYPHITFHFGDGSEDLSNVSALAPGSFDAVISIETIEHVYTPRQFARNLHNLLKAGGLLFITTPYHGYLKNLSIALLNDFDSHVNPLWDCGHVKFWSKSTLGKLLIECGFEQIQFYGAGRIPYLWKSMILVARKP